MAYPGGVNHMAYPGGVNRMVHSFASVEYLHHLPEERCGEIWISQPLALSREETLLEGSIDLKVEVNAKFWLLFGQKICK
ncbi:MAG: hypothetical protein KAW02_04085 [candidate division Zixibacteria bacterium]|nr:hypothetical protein [candidate division Zixibacteria bacterium]